MKIKVRAYAIFQFLSLIALMLLMASGFLFIVNAVGVASGDVGTYLKSEFVDVLQFQQLDGIGILSSLFFYISIGLFVFSWTSGWTIFKVKDRNFFDSMFLMFICIPVISNIFCLLAQLSFHSKTYTSTIVTKEEREQEETMIIELLEKNRELDAKKAAKLEVKKKIKEDKEAIENDAPLEEVKKPNKKASTAKKTPAKKSTTKTKPSPKKTTSTKKK